MNEKLRFHIRIIYWHFKVYPDWRITKEYNHYHKYKWLPDGYISIYDYEFFFKPKKFFQ